MVYQQSRSLTLGSRLLACNVSSTCSLENKLRTGQGSKLFTLKIKNNPITYQKNIKVTGVDLIIFFGVNFLALL